MSKSLVSSEHLPRASSGSENVALNWSVADVVLETYAAEGLVGRHIDTPQPGDRGMNVLDISGWAIGRDMPITNLKLLEGTSLLRTIPRDVARPDVAQAFPGVVDAHFSGFSTKTSLLGLPDVCQLSIRAVFQDGREIPLAVIGVNRSARIGERTSLNPLMMSALGRSGTTLLAALVFQHPHVVGLREYPYEFGVARYWANAASVLSEPASAVSSPRSETFHLNPFEFPVNPYFNPAFGPDSPLLSWFAYQQPQLVARTVIEAIDRTYRAVASLQGQSLIHYFAEKMPPGRPQGVLWDLYPHSKEVFLVRDFRDVLASILAFNEKRGFDAFGREAVASDEEFVRSLRGTIDRLLYDWRARGHRSLLIRYEDLALAPEAEIARVFEYAGLDFDAGDLSGMVAAVGARSDVLADHRTSNDVAASISRWERDLPPALAEACTQEFRDALNTFGYRS